MKYLNTILTVIFSATILLFSAIFFLGGQNEHAILKENLLLNLVIRIVGFALPGILLFIILLLTNYFSDKKAGIRKPLLIGLNGLMYCVISSFIGSLFFFIY